MNTPSWAREPFSNFIEYHDRIHNFYHLTVDGLGIIIHSSQRVEELTLELEALDHRKIEDDGRRKAARLRAEKAKWEVDNGFPTLHEQQTVALWTSLECLIEDFLTAWMANTPSSMQLDEIRKVRISISDYQQMQDSDKYHYLLGELERSEIGLQTRM